MIPMLDCFEDTLANVGLTEVWPNRNKMMWLKLGGNSLSVSWIESGENWVKFQVGFHLMGPRRWSLGVLFISVDWQVRMFRPSGIIDIPLDGLYIRTIPMSGCMDRRSRYMVNLRRSGPWQKIKILPRCKKRNMGIRNPPRDGKWVKNRP